MSVLFKVTRNLSNCNVYKLQLHLSKCAYSTKVLYPLDSRKLLKVKGSDASVFLQGLITNDMRHFEEGAKSIYAMFLNNKGRVLYDTLIHKWDGADSFMVECDKDILSLLHRHLKLYKLKRTVEFEDVNEMFKLWALILPTNDIVDTKICPNNAINIYKDPRLSELGYRVISTNQSETPLMINKIIGNIHVGNEEDEYKLLRYKLGVSEGASDLPPGSTFPLEVNCDYLHGVSFHKGCYIGQELTARVHHTGVVRKRIMPIKFHQQPQDQIEKDTTISAKNNTKSNIGKFKGSIHEYGIGLLRIKEALDANILSIGKHTAEVVKPAWWPIEAPKEKVIAK